MNLNDKRNRKEREKNRKKALTPVNIVIKLFIVIMLLTAIPVLYIGINLQEKWIYMSAQREAARMAARSNAGPFFNIVEAFIQIVVASIIIYALYKGYKYIKAKEEEYDEKVLILF